MSDKKILYMSRPDEQTLKFWKATADDQNEYVARIAKFSLALSDSQTQPTACSTNAGTQSERGGNVAAPGVRAKKTGTKLRRGRALQVMVYPRQWTKRVPVEASRDVKRPLSSFMLLASLKEAAALRGCDIADLIPPDELQQYRASRINRKRSAAAKRVSVSAKRA